jgi:fatty acid desaturase
MAIIMYVTVKLDHIAAYFIAIPLIANRQHSLLIQMHDAAHGNISKNKKINDLVGELLTAWPMFIRMASYRDVHNKHHSYTNTNKDPDYIEERFPQSREEIIPMLLKDLLGFGVFGQFKNLKRLKTPMSTQTRIARLVFFTIIAAAITYFGVWKYYLVLWIVPLFTWLKLILHIRSISDHSGPDLQLKAHPFNSRTVVPSWFDILFIAPRNCSYHMAHSIYASVPTYHLKKCHEEIMKLEIFQKEARITHGYHNVIKEFPKHKTEVKESGFDFYDEIKV